MLSACTGVCKYNGIFHDMRQILGIRLDLSEGAKNA